MENIYDVHIPEPVGEGKVLTVSGGQWQLGTMGGLLPEASADAIGGVKLAENQADSTAEELATLVTDFNTLLASLKAAGIMAPDEEEEEG